VRCIAVWGEIRARFVEIALEDVVIKRCGKKYP
jgi:hypothetical protein